jgi:glutamate racemase
MDYRLYTGDLAATAAPIGIFDSGVGGLTVLRELHRQLPHESILYFGDTARLPYGTRTASEINQFVREILAWMIAQGAKMVLMACNTSSALALEAAQADCPIPVLGVILPGARAAVKTGRRIGVIATAATANSHAYRQAITESDSQAQVWEVGCPEFVPLIEQNRIHDPYTRTVAANYLAPLLAHNIDTLIYGCTHYPHLAPVLKDLLPPTVTRLDPAAHLAAATARELDLLGLRATGQRRPTLFAVSGDPSHFSPLAAQWLGHPVEVQQVSLTSQTSSKTDQVSALNLSQRERR